MSQAEEQPGSKIKFLVRPDNAVFIAKAVKEKVGPSEAVDDFRKQNPAANKLMHEIEDAFDTMSESLVKEIRKVLANGSR